MPALGSLLSQGLGAGRWLTRGRMSAYAAILLAVELLVFAFLIAGTHGWVVPLSKPVTTPFASFYAAGTLANAGTPALAYDPAQQYAAEQRAVAPGIPYELFYYPPTFLTICAGLAHLPYYAAFLLFELATLLFYLLVGRGILGDREWTVFLPLLAFPAVFWTLGLGQNAFLTAALFGAALMQLDRRPLRAGLLFGALCYKPQYGLLIVVALAAGRHWRAFAGAIIAVAALSVLSVTLFGWESWRGFLAIAAGSHASYESGRVDLAGLVSVFAAIRMLGGSLVVAYAAQGAATLAAMALVAWVWWRGLSLPIRGATLAAATLVAIPMVLIYDLMLAVIAAAWLLRAGHERGFLAWEKATLAALFAIPLVSRSVGTSWHVPLAPFGVLVLFLLVAACARHEVTQGGARDRASIAGAARKASYGVT